MGLSLPDCDSVSGVGYHQDDLRSRPIACEVQKGRKTGGLVMLGLDLGLNLSTLDLGLWSS